MKRMHVNLGVRDLEASVEFYNALFNTTPSVQKPDYAKWSLEDPSVNFSVSLGENSRINHLGIEVTEESELQDVYANIEKADAVRREEGHTICCYAQSEKSWVKDPDGVEWEAFHTYGSSPVNKVATSECCDDTCCVA